MDEQSTANSGETTPPVPPTENNQNGQPAAPGENAGDDKNVPFHLHPRWKEREDQMNKRFEEQERKHNETLKQYEDRMKGLEDRFAPKEKVNLPHWWAGDEEGYKQYLKDEDERFEGRYKSRLAREKEVEKQANEHLENSFKEIAKAEGKEISQSEKNKLYKFISEYPKQQYLVDAQGRWNIELAWDLMKSKEKPANPGSDDDLEARKRIASAGMENDKGKPGARDFKTSDDFRRKAK